MPKLTVDIDWPVETEHLVLRPATLDDLAATWAIRRLDAVSRWLTRAPQSFQEHQEQFTEPDSLAKTIVITLDGTVIGDLMVAIGDAWAQAEVIDAARDVQADLGWTLHPDHTGRGFATEALEAVLRICFDQLGLRRVTADCFAANERSWRLMERIGMRRETHSVRDSLHRSGAWLDGYGYALLADEWRAAVTAQAGGKPTSDGDA